MSYMEIFHNIKILEQNRKDLRKRMTRSETLLWSKLRGKQSGFKFRRQHSIGSFIVDFYCAECGLVVELDGLTHNDEKRSMQDQIKEHFLKTKGCTVLHFNDDEVLRNSESVLSAIWIRCDSLIRGKKT